MSDRRLLKLIFELSERIKVLEERVRKLENPISEKQRQYLLTWLREVDK